MIVKKITNVADLKNFCLEFNLHLPNELALEYCRSKEKFPSVITYGIYENDKLISIMTVTFYYVFFHNDSKNGRIGHISGAYTLPKYRHNGYATTLLKFIIDKANEYNVDYLCCDSKADDLYYKQGFILSDDSSRLWLPLKGDK